MLGECWTAMSPRPTRTHTNGDQTCLERRWASGKCCKCKCNEMRFKASFTRTFNIGLAAPQR
uniref:Uncharacterized protein n=1 Tax=Denticeps clupeoides TaxID=299321 RepID=A0AAY4B2Y5_9TELE